MKIPLFQVDAFTDHVFKGNPAAVCPLPHWLPDEVMQMIAMENNLSETAFFVAEGSGYRIRWFTPLSEVDLCGHATLATSHVLYHHLHHKESVLHFFSKSGELIVSKGEKGIINMNFPAYKVQPVPNDPVYREIFGIQPVAVYRGNYLMLVYPTEENVRSIQPDFERVKSLDKVGVIITAKGNDYDFVSRFFAPAMGISEDPVTGSAFSTLIPFWAENLRKNKLKACQCSSRGGLVEGEEAEDRVVIGGKAVTFMKGTFSI